NTKLYFVLLLLPFRPLEMASPVESAVMKSTVLVAPVTALEFLGEDLLLTGEGPILSVYSLQASPKECTSLNVLHNYRIHGIRPSRKCQFGERQFNNVISCESSVLDNDKEDIIVFGGKGVRLVSFNTGRRCLKLIGPLLELQDWVLDIHWLKGQPHPLLGISLAHNAVLLLDAETGNVLSFYSCVESCLLYSALMIGPNWDSLVLVGGTVFNQLVLWRPTGTKPDGQSQVERRLLGHSGVIFSLCYLQKSGWLASASDDRSVRLWSVGTLGGDSGCGEESPTCLRVLYGHQARVFCVRLAPNRVFSVGEDGACLLWEWGGEGKVGHTFRGHRSGGVRALAVSKGSIGCKEGWMATGGADGGVRVWRVAEEKKDGKETKAETLDLGFKGQGCPKVVRLVGEGEPYTVLVCTDQGEVCLSQGDTWDVIWQGGAEFQSYCVMEITSIQVQNSDCIVWVCAVGNLKGGVQVFLVGQPGVGVLLRAGEGKVHSVLWVKGLFEGSWSWCLLASDSEGLVYRWTIKVIEDESGLHMKEETLLPFLLPPCAKRWLTAAVTLSQRKGLYLCGDRRGSLLLYTERGENDRRNDGGERRTDLQDQETENKQTDHGGPLSSISTLYGVHGKQGVTSVCEYQDLCYSTGRDGSVRILTVEENILKVRRVQRACKGMEWIEKVLFLGLDGLEVQGKLLNERTEKRKIDQESAIIAETRFVMVGFHSVHLVIWDPHRQEKLLSVACGGGHRSWAYKHPINMDTDPQAHTLGQGTLLFIKHGAVMASRSLASTETDVNAHTLKEGLHGRGISCVCHLGSLTKTGQLSELWEVFVTGGEDTTVGVLAIRPQSGTVKVLSVLTDHISNVRALAAIRRGETNEKGRDDVTDTSSLSSLVFSVGGRAQLQCYRLLMHLDEQQSQPICQVTQIAGHRLDEQWERKRNRHKTVKMDPETRYMSMAVVQNGTDCVLLALGCSDGAVRLFCVTESSRSVDMLWESFYHQRCVLSVATYKLEDSQDRKLLLLFSGTTDGCISVWDLTAVLNSKASVSWQGPSAPFFSIPVHQSGVNTLALSPRREMRQMEENIISLASGGDDGQLSLLHIKIDQKGQENGGVSLQLLSHCSVPLAHSSPLTGLCLLSPTLLVSTSPDQRLCLWSVNSDGLRPLKVLFSHTADAAGLWAWFGQEGGAWVLVCGQGLQLFQLTEREMDKLNETKVIFPHHVSRTKH
uniref:tRNA (34-2'-O)-methyltransferase regulator WDR6 n=1 Tax=Sinocyclocheilus rhinocerous TaxID=307959 RepID=A0A673HGX0_9TELE